MRVIQKLYTLLILSLALIGATAPANAQKNISLEIRNVSINDAQAKKGADSKSRLAPVNVQFICNGTEDVRFSGLEATLETFNTDGARSRVVKGIVDGTSNTRREVRIDLSLPEGVFPKEFTLTLKGKWRLGNAAKWVDVSAVKKGSFPLPANLVERKK